MKDYEKLVKKNEELNQRIKSAKKRLRDILLYWIKFNPSNQLKEDQLKSVISILDGE